LIPCTHHVIDIICDKIKILNGGFARPDPNGVEENGVRRQLGKGYLNTLWGKLVQKAAMLHEKFIFTMKEYHQLLNDPEINPESLKFRHIHTYMFKAQYEKRTNNFDEFNPFLSIPIGASVTAHAQVLLMRKMFAIGVENMLYCDTDSLILKRPIGAPCLTSRGLGNWEPEYATDKKGNPIRILQFIALAPKCYMIRTDQIEEEEDEVTKVVTKKNLESTKCKGVKMTVVNRKTITFEAFKTLVKSTYDDEDLEKPLVAETMVIYPNSTNRFLPYGTLCTRNGHKKVGVVYTKRNFCRLPRVEFDSVALVRLLPHSYDGKVENVVVEINNDLI
jgi:hypothetical protein